MKNYLYGAGWTAIFGVAAAVVWLSRPLVRGGALFDWADETWQDDLDTHEDVRPCWETMQAQDSFYAALDKYWWRR